MPTRIVIGSALVLSLIGTGCATKKYVTKSIAPIESRVTATEDKNVEQDKQIASETEQIDVLDRDLARTKERLTETDAKAVAAGEAARTADGKAAGAQQTAEAAGKAAEAARSFAANGLDQLARTVDATNKFKMLNSETVLFPFDKWTLTEDSKQRLSEFAKASGALDRYVIEIQGFTDKSGSPNYNATLSEQRADTVARYLTNEFKIPLRNIRVLGSGYAQPVADDKTSEGRKQNRRVEVRLYVPETTTAASPAPTGIQ